MFQQTKRWGNKVYKNDLNKLKEQEWLKQAKKWDVGSAIENA